MLKALLVGFALTSAAVGGAWFSPAHAQNVKDCGTAVTPVTNPPNSNAGFTQTATTTQTSACNSASNNKQVITTGPTTNKAGGTPGGH